MINIVIPMAGEGSRTKEYHSPKPLIPINGKTMIERAIQSLDIPGRYIFIVRNYQNDLLNEQLRSTLNEIQPNCVIISIQFLTDGPAQTALFASQYIDNRESLVIANCDQIMEWDAQKFVGYVTQTTDDGVVVTWNKMRPTESFIGLDDQGYGVKICEKKMVPWANGVKRQTALNGIHFWKHGQDFVRSAKKMIGRNLRDNGEFYIAPTYNILMQEGKKISTYHINTDEHWAVGTSKDIETYENR